MNSKVGGEKGIFVGEFRLVLLFWLLVLTFVRISKLQPNTTCYFIVLTGISSNDYLDTKNPFDLFSVRTYDWYVQVRMNTVQFLFVF